MNIKINPTFMFIRNLISLKIAKQTKIFEFLKIVTEDVYFNRDSTKNMVFLRNMFVLIGIWKCLYWTKNFSTSTQDFELGVDYYIVISSQRDKIEKRNGDNKNFISSLKRRSIILIIILQQ